MRGEADWADVGESKLDSLHFFENLDRINRAIQGTSDLDKMMRNVLEEVRSIFDCDRAFLLYPCNPDADSWTVPMESTFLEYPGAGIMNIDIPMDQDVAEKMRLLLACDGVLKFGLGTEHPLPASISQRFGIKSFIATALHPKSGDTWELGIHQCSHDRTWTSGEEQLLLEVGRRLTDALTSLLVMRELQESEAKYRHFVEASSEGTVGLNSKHIITFVNARVVEMVGYSTDELVGHPLSDFIFEKDIADHEQHMTLRRRGVSEQYERRFRCKDGSELWAQVSASVINGDTGQFQGSFAMLTDITKRKRAEQRMAMLESAVNQSSDAIFLMDDDARFNYVNDAACRNLGYSLEELVSMSPIDIDPDMPVEKARALTKQVIAGSPVNFETRHRARNGRIFPVEIHASPVEFDGRMFSLAVVHDITERKQAEHRLSLLNFALNNVKEAAFLIDEHARFHFVNKESCHILGYSSDELMALGVEDVDPDLPRERWPEHWQQLKEQKSLTFEGSHKRKDGRIIPVEVNANFIEYADQHYNLALVRDITERKQAEIKLHHLNRELQAISNCNQSLLKASDEQQLLNNICSIICEQAGYLLAWVGFAENDEVKTMRPAAWAGGGSDYIAKAKLSWSENVEHGRGPAGMVIRNGESVYVEDFEDSALMTPWRQGALEHGYHSGIALPLKNANGQSFGALLIYSGEKHAINQDEIRLLEDLAGGMAYGITTLRAQTEIRRTTEALAASENLQRLLLDSLTQQVFYKDLNSRYIACNRTFAGGLGMEPEELVGKSDFEIYPHELAGRYRADDVVVMKSGKTIQVEEPYEAGGHKFWVHTVKTPMRDAAGKVTGVLGIFWDVSEQRRAVQELEQSRASLAEAQRIAKLGSWELNLVTDKLTWSDEVYEIFEIDKVEFGASYKAFLNAIHPEDYEKANRAYSDSLNNRAAYDIVHRLLMKDGRIKYVNERWETSFDESGKPLRSTGTVQDITAMHEVEEQLRQAQKMEVVGTLVGGIAHDFNNKLAAITGNLYLARHGVDSHSETAARLQAVETLSFEAASMVKQLLTFARKGKIEQKPLALVPFIKETAKLNSVAIPENIHLALSYCENPLLITGDITQLQQLFLNLLTNAHDALEGVDQARIDLSLQYYRPDSEFIERHPETAHVDAFACMRLCDNGHGIAAEHLAQVFDPFFTTKEVGKGTGLGLAMVYGIVTSHHGVIEVESKPEQGSCFSIYLPLQSNTNTALPTDQQQEVINGDGETILLADDDENVLQTFADVLTSINYRVLIARDGRTALEIYRQHRDEIDLVILDIIMPKLTGLDVAGQIREVAPDAKLLFATGYDKEPDHLGITGNIEVLDKPYDLAKVSRSIRHMLERESPRKADSR